ncbi:methyltransferase-like protein 25 isoform X3 [Microcaecilia unicolor]|uniref:Methyltransferase-like protein 25 isoform X3 n=1 Tax=Microcaecilia unicolor TaxID=1415580 RepID=A0A6P7Z0Q1_9AMPH|nr:methyltransferase-like protein 25 isoform X3 [Microcaecilia unicolor]
MAAGERSPLFSLPTVVVDRRELVPRLRALCRFLARALRLSRAHTVDFYARDVWQQLVGAAVSPDSVLLTALKPRGSRQTRPWDVDEFSGIFCENSNKLVDLESFLDAAKAFSLPYLGICTSLRQLIGVLKGMEEEETDKKMRTDEFMNSKKSHEVLVMSQLVNCLANYCGIKQVIDLGSGKGYLSSFLSLHYDLKVYGIDSSSINTSGATERNRKLKKYWKAYQNHSGGGSSRDPMSEREKQRTAQYNMMCKETVSGKHLSSNISSPCQDQVIKSGSPSETNVHPVVSAMIGTDKETCLHLAGQPEPEEDELCQHAFSFLKILPTNAVETASSSKSFHQGDLCGEEKEQKKTVNIKAKADKLNESNVYSPLTSYITAKTELHDIVTDLEDSMLVGLHTCGDLAPTTLRLFASKPEIKAVCSVGCCYHLLSEEFENTAEEFTQETWGFPMCQYLREEAWCCGRNARMSACLALERVAVSQGLSPESLFYRAVLQVIIKECYGVTRSDGRVGKVFSKSSSFPDYVRKSLKKLGLDESKLKVVLAPCIETLILLDRLCYLTEQDDVGWCGLVQSFDPVKSPRCYAVVALKK